MPETATHHRSASASPSVPLILLAALSQAFVGALIARAAEPSPPAPTAAEEALVLLESHCVRCHGGEKTKGGLSLLTRESLLRGGENGPAVVPGKPNESLLLKAVRHEVEATMPPKEKKLADASIARLTEWVAAGAPYPRALNKAGATAKVEFTISDADRKHWAFQPVKRVTPPEVGGALPADANPIDRFILDRLRRSGIEGFSPPASKSALIRRVTFDLIGLPPTPSEVEGFVKDESPDAYERLIDRLLASPQYGERWGRHWLDLARYAETDGFEHDAIRPHSWRYRDYVIRSFNADKPYDRFVREQLAGDELWPGDPDALIATGFNLLGPDMVDSADQVQRKQNTLNDMTDTAGLAFLGLTIACARCHDHKFEPLSQRDYYRLQASFATAAIVREQPVATPADLAAREEATRKYEGQAAVRELAELESPVRARLLAAKVKKLSPEAQAAHAVPADKRTTEQANLVLETEEMIKITDGEVAGAFTGAAQAKRKELLEAMKQIPRPSPPPLAMALGKGKGPAAKTFILNRGEYSQPGDEVGPGFPTVLEPKDEGGRLKDEGKADAVTSASASGRRAALAEWLTSPANPLAARVMVNRIWQHHFGRGLVATPSDFGTRGAPPTHPELLDWLAGEFIARGWSVKQMHKMMLMSTTYRQGASPGAGVMAAGAKVDPDNRLYWRMNRLRLEGEVIRDSLLAVSGKLNLEMGGPGVSPPIPADALKGATGWTVSKSAADQCRRSVYIFARRNLRFPFLEVFDAPDTNLSCPARDRSTTAPQALTLLNADEVMAAAKALATRLETEAKSEPERVTLAYQLSLGRSPTAREMELSHAFLAGGAPLSELCRVLFNLNEFVYLE